MPEKSVTPGRPRNGDIDTEVLAVARRHLADSGYESLSISAVAQEAGTTRQALYRRWPSKADLATAAIASMPEADPQVETDDPFHDLLVELAAFHRGVSRRNGVSMVGTMLQATFDPELRELYQQRLVAPRRRRLRSILRRAIDQGLLDPKADLEFATAACSGILYAQSLAGTLVTKGWPVRTARLVWRSCGGTPPADEPSAD